MGRNFQLPESLVQYPGCLVVYPYGSEGHSDSLHGDPDNSDPDKLVVESHRFAVYPDSLRSESFVVDSDNLVVESH